MNDQEKLEYETKDDFEQHKEKCARSFETLFENQDAQNRAMFGDPKLHEKGVLAMTREMYNSVMFARRTEKMFWTIVRFASGVLIIGSAITGLYEALKIICKKMIN